MVFLGVVFYCCAGSAARLSALSCGVPATQCDQFALHVCPYLAAWKGHSPRSPMRQDEDNGERSTPGAYEMLMESYIWLIDRILGLDEV